MLLNYISISWLILKNIVLKEKHPLFVGFALTNHCNLHCKYCATYQFKEKEMSFIQIKKILLDLSKNNCHYIWFTGGEPLMRKDINQIINEAYKLNFHISLATNGHLLGKHLSIINKLNHVTLSLDGPEGVHDLLRGKGSYQEVLHAISILKTNKTKFSLTAVVNNLNYKSIGELAVFAKTNKIRIVFQFIDVNHFTNNLSKIKPLLIPRKQIMNIKKSLIKIHSKNHYLDISSITTPVNSVNSKTCLAGKLFFRITAGGKLLCCWRQNNKDSADLTTEPLSSAISSFGTPSCSQCNKYHGIKLYKISSIFNNFIRTFK